MKNITIRENEPLNITYIAEDGSGHIFEGVSPNYIEFIYSRDFCGTITQTETILHFINGKSFKIPKISKEDKMNFQEAYLKMLDGEKVRVVGWSKEEYIEKKGYVIVCEDYSKFLPSKNTVLDDWELYEEETIEIDGKKFSLSTVKEALKKHVTF